MSEVKSADRKPEIWTDPDTGKKRIRLVPTDKKVVNKDKKWTPPVSESVDTNRVKQLGTLGLVDKKDVQRLMIIMKKLDDDKELNIREKNMVVNMFQQLISIVTGDVSVFAKTKRAVSEAKEDNEPASPDEAGMAMSQLKFINYAADEIMEYIQEGAAFPEWFQNKLTGTYESMKDLHAFMEGNEYEEEENA